ncbi:E3 ubiquitin-protein ligase UPL3-like [Corylus avellana]|uniref:E3 ubiquitin-protein ligase UPL3-like n=1 Tax=Corylus avellana TaxID=13451 RepID=UPI00286B90CB|nr:E3 ubiquitin-protein ligase UPL3-like [Corylus avellana]
METRSRKRAEATSAAPSSSSSGPTTRSSKRARLLSSAATSSASSAALSLISTRSRSAASVKANDHPMDPTTESSGSRRRGRNSDNRDNSEKGKEKEHEIRVRDRDRERERDRDNERSLGLNVDAGCDDDDNDSEGGGVGILHQNLTSASSALQGLLRKLGAGLDDLLPSSAMGSSSASHQSGRLKKILSGLRADGEEGRQVEALTQLCEMLSIGTEESLSTFSVDSFVPVLVGLLNHESNPDIMLLAARALTHLCDVLPSSCAAVVHYGAVSCFCARLLTIEYMDLAEQSLQALKKISQEHPTACLRAGALMAVLSYLDFFSTGVQRVALSTAANMCKKLPSDAADFVMEAVPLLTNLLQYHDSKVLEHASVCLTRIAEAFASSPDKLDELCNHGLVTQAASLISTSNSGGGQASLSAPTYTGLIRLLSTCASGSPLGSKTLLLLGISGILKDILAGSGISTNASVSPALSRPAEQIFEIVNLANELLPPLPQGTISLPSSSNLFVKGSVVKKSSAGSSGKQEDTNGNVPEVSAREKLLNDQPELLQQFGMDLLPVLIQIYGSSVNGPVRHKCLSVIGKLMYFSTAEMIQSLLSVTNISSFLAGVLAWKDPHVLIPALQIAEILMEKLPGTFSKMFVREGVVHAVDQLILAGNPNPAGSSSAEKENESGPGTSSRSRRYRRRSGSTNLDGGASEESKNPGSVNIGSPPSSVEIPSVNSNLRMAVSSCAKAFKDKYFPSEPGSVEVGVTDDLLHLKNLCMKLNAGRTNEEIVQDAFESFEIDDDVVEVNSLGDDSVSMGNKKRKRSVGRPQMFDNIMTSFLMLIQMTRRYGQNARLQDGLKEISDTIQKVRDSVKWNSTYLMLESAVYYRRAFSYLEMTDKNYKHCPTAVEWETVDNIKSFLACFYQATCAFSGTKYPTANLYFYVIAMIYVSLKEDIVSGDEHKSLMATQMLSKFEKYWLDFSEVLVVAVILDPRYKLHLVNYYYTKIYGVMNST